MPVPRLPEDVVLTDFHSHCLPGMDDGARTVEESVAMLQASLDQGIKTVVATSHFYAGPESVESFLARREKAWKKLAPSVPSGMTVLLGAEVLVRDGVSRLDLRPLCMEGTERILLELPFKKQPRWMDEELESILFGQRLLPVFAHVERYMDWYSASSIMDLLGPYSEAVIQLNGAAFLHGSVRRKLLRWLPPPFPMVFGSDMHRPTGRRSPNLASGYDKMIRTRFRSFWEERLAAGEYSLRREMPQEGENDETL